MLDRDGSPAENAPINPELTFVINRSIQKLFEELRSRIELEDPGFMESVPYPSIMADADDELFKDLDLRSWNGSFFSFTNMAGYVNDNFNLTGCQIKIDLKPDSPGPTRPYDPEGTVSTISFEAWDFSSNESRMVSKTFYVRSEVGPVVGIRRFYGSDKQVDVQQQTATQQDGQVLLVDLDQLMQRMVEI